MHAAMCPLNVAECHEELRHLNAGILQDLDAGAADQRIGVRHPDHDLHS